MRTQLNSGGSNKQFLIKNGEPLVEGITLGVGVTKVAGKYITNTTGRGGVTISSPLLSGKILIIEGTCTGPIADKSHIQLRRVQNSALYRENYDLFNENSADIETYIGLSFNGAPLTGTTAEIYLYGNAYGIRVYHAWLESLVPIVV